jgi:hypothetical protein
MRMGGGQVSELTRVHSILNDLYALFETLKEFQEYLRATFPEGFVFRRISGEQGDRGAERLVDGTASQLDFVAALYDSASHVRQLEAALTISWPTLLTRRPMLLNNSTWGLSYAKCGAFWSDWRTFISCPRRLRRSKAIQARRNPVIRSWIRLICNATCAKPSTRERV